MRTIILLLCCCIASGLIAQPPVATREIRVTVQTSEKQSLPFATVSLLTKDSIPVQTLVTDSLGRANFSNLSPGKYVARASVINFQVNHTSLIDLTTSTNFTAAITLEPAASIMGNVTVTAKKPLVQFMPDKTVINVEAGITNAGATVMEVLEKSPGVTVDRDGNITLKGRAGVQVMIDGKLTQLSGADLQNLLNGMNASQVETIELMDNPPAKYDAAGNAGLINIRTKKVKQKGFNGTLTLAYGQGRRPKNNNSIILNYRNGDVNFFFNYSLNANKYLMDLYALRTYYDDNGSVTALFEQPYKTRGTGLTHNLRTGIDYSISKKTTAGFAFTGTYLTRDADGNALASWKNASGVQDSVIRTYSTNYSRLKQGGINFNARHSFNSKEELTADVDLIRYDIFADQYFENISSVAGSRADVSKGNIPSDIKIFSAKADYSKQFSGFLWEAGWKTSSVNTDNLARYQYLDNTWQEDLGKSNHFLYKEDIHALYSSLDRRSGRFHFQAGLRYEYTTYKARQLGNAVVKDSSFNRKYGNLFPTLFVSYEADSANTVTFRAGRRVDRPGFQKLNPFVFIINKYTFQRGNPYFLPQYTWNMEVSHQYKDILSTGVSYSITDDYFSQIFLSDTANGTIVYTEGNVGKMQNLGVSMSIQWPVTSWWSLSGQAVFNRKIIEGVLWRTYKATINQGTFSMNNQFRFKKGWSAELSGFYVTKSQNDLQEVLDPTGQLAAGFSKQVLKNKGTLRLVVRDIFYTQAMEGLTDFQNTKEYFKLMRDTRVATLSFTWRFGKSMKQIKRSSGSAQELIERAGSVN